MEFDFNERIDRSKTISIKWSPEQLEKMYGERDIIPMGIADMDLKTAPCVSEAICRRAAHETYGYSYASGEFLSSCAEWQRRRHGWAVEPEWITYTPGVNMALVCAVEMYTQPGDSVIIQTPVYMPFYRTVREAGRIIVKNPLIYENGRYTMNFDELEKLVTPTCRTLILCSPHNPVARVWSREELERLADIAVRKNMIIIADEIHQDLVFSDAKHICIGSLPGMAERTVTFIAPSKTFNIAGMKASVAIIPDELLRGIYVSVLERFHLNSINILGITAMEAAYGKCGEWHKELMDHLEGNRDYMEAFVKERMPKAHMDHPEGTYIFWIDFRGYGFNDETLTDFLVNEAKVALDPGTWFGVEGDGFARLNIGTTRAMLKEGLERIADALDKRENGK